MPAFVQVRRMLYYEPNLSLSTPITGLPVTYIFTANGLYDPNITGSGHQPMGFDQMMALFDQYVVTRSSITVTYRPHGSICMGVSLSPDASAYTSSPGLVENGLSKYFCSSGIATEVGEGFRRITLHCDVRGYFGPKTSREMLNNPNLIGTAASNPTEQVYFFVNAWQGIGIAGGGINVDFEAVLAYDAIFFEPRKLGPSLGKLTTAELSRPAPVLPQPEQETKSLLVETKSDLDFGFTECSPPYTIPQKRNLADMILDLQNRLSTIAISCNLPSELPDEEVTSPKHALACTGHGVKDRQARAFSGSQTAPYGLEAFK